MLFFENYTLPKHLLFPAGLRSQNDVVVIETRGLGYGSPLFSIIINVFCELPTVF